jgi:2-oxoglutarate ferredoxin oxidoreductase subunit delta
MKIFPDGQKVSRGEVHLVERLCKGCGFCITYCPMDVLEISEKFNVKGYHFPEVRRPERCVNCGLCGLICPDFAIWSTLREEIDVSTILNQGLLVYAEGKADE